MRVNFLLLEVILIGISEFSRNVLYITSSIIPSSSSYKVLRQCTDKQQTYVTYQTACCTRTNRWIMINVLYGTNEPQAVLLQKSQIGKPHLPSVWNPR